MTDPQQPFAPPTPLPSYPGAGPVHQLPPTKRRWVIPVIVVSALLVVTLVVVGLASALNSVIAARPPAGDPLVTGEVNFPNAPVLLDCDVCFDEFDVPATVLAESTVEELGMTKHDFPYGTYDSTTADELFRSVTATWKAQEGAPDACIFVPGNSPSVVDLVSDDGSTDVIEFTGSHATSDVTSTLDQSVRVFANQADAMGHMSRLFYQVQGCPQISMGAGNEQYTAVITPAPALTLPDDIEIMGWVRTGDPGARWRAYVFDMRRGNIVVRTRMITDGSISEETFRSFVEEYALQLETLEPALG